MIAYKHVSKIIVALMAIAVTLCFLAVMFADPLSEMMGGSTVRMEYETALFDTDEPISVNIIMDEDDWNEMLKNAMTEVYYVCDVEINGTTVKNVAIRPKGNTSLSAIAMDPDTDRYSLKLEFDHFVKGQTCYGLDKLILNNNYADATNMKEAIIYDMYQYLGADASLYNYAKVSVNGEYWGVYLALEAVEESFMLRNFGTQDGELYKPDSMEMGGGDSSKSDDKGAPSFGGGGFDFSNMPDMGDFDMSNMPDTGSFDFGSMPDNGNFDFGNMPEKDREEAPSEENSEDKDSKSSFGGGQGGFGGGKGGFPGGGGFNFDSENMPDMDDFDMSNMPDMGSFDFGSMPENGNFDFGNMPEKGSEEAPSEDSSEDKDSKPSPGGGGGFPGGGGGGFSFGNGGANLNYTDDDLDSYSTIWDGEVTGTSKADHKRVVTALKNISEGTDIEEYLDVDNVLKYMAVHTFSVNMDSLSGSMAHNYYLYEYDGKLNIFPWDYNLSLGGMSMGGGSDGTSVVNDAIDTPFSGTQFFDALLENEEYLAKYHEYLDMLVEEYVNGGRFDEVYSRIRSRIDSLVEEDPTAFYDYDEYETAAETLYETIRLRAQSIRGQLDGTIPSTDEGQRNSDALVDASHIDIKSMGTFNMGDNDSGDDFRKGMRK